MLYVEKSIYFFTTESFKQSQYLEVIRAGLLFVWVPVQGLRSERPSFHAFSSQFHTGIAVLMGTGGKHCV
jgi:hypothetical protein